jgi:hypothetical protein
MVDSIEEAEARFADMRRYMTTLHLAISLAPYIFADEVYQSKRYGMLGQLPRGAYGALSDGFYYHKSRLSSKGQQSA